MKVLGDKFLYETVHLVECAGTSSREALAEVAEVPAVRARQGDAEREEDAVEMDLGVVHAHDVHQLLADDLRQACVPCAVQRRVLADGHEEVFSAQRRLVDGLGLSPSLHGPLSFASPSLLRRINALQERKSVISIKKTP